MAVEIREVKSKSELRKFVKFQNELYKGNPNYVTQIVSEEMENFNRKKNPAFEVNDARFFMALRDGKIVGRIAGIHNKPANKKNNTQNLRFSWFETIDDYEVAEALYKKVEEWGRELGMKTMTGPHGFCDMDQQGMLIEGFDKPGTIASFYHHPYYKEFTERYGFQKDIDYVEYWSTVPHETGVPEKMLRTAEWIKKRYNFKLVEYDTVKEYIKRGPELFELLEESFEDNYGTVPLTEKQVAYYIKKYISYIQKDLIKIVDNEKGEMIGFMVTMPSMTKGYQKTKGNLLPFGFIHLMRALKRYDILDFYFIGVRKDYRNKGVDVLMAVEIVKAALKLGFSYAESNQELETNTRVQAQWKFFNPVQHKRRRIYKKKIT